MPFSDIYLPKFIPKLKLLTTFAAHVFYFTTSQAAPIPPIQYQGTLLTQVEDFRGYAFSKNYSIQVRYNPNSTVLGKAVVFEETRCLAENPQSNECYIPSNNETYCVTQVDLHLGAVQWEILDTDPDANKAKQSQSLWQSRVSRSYKKGSSPCQSLSLDGMKVTSETTGDARFESPLQPGVRTGIHLATAPKEGPRTYLISKGHNLYGIGRITLPNKITTTWTYDLVARSRTGKSWRAQGNLLLLVVPTEND